MIILNTTFVVHSDVEADVLQWIKGAYIESARKFISDKTHPFIAKVLGSHNNDTISYAVHVMFADIAVAQKWNDGVASSLRAIMQRRWGDKALAFYTYLELLDD